MLYYFYGIISIFIIYTVVFAVISVKYRIGVKVMAFNSISGIIFLALVKAIAPLIEYDICINLISVVLSLLFGPPGILFFALFNYLFL